MTLRTLHVMAACTAISATLVSTAWSSPPVRGDGVLIEESRNITMFDRIHATGPYQLEITNSPDYNVTVSGDSNIVPILETKIQDRTLFIFLSTEIEPQLPLVMRLSLPSIDAISSSGSISTNIGAFSGNELQLEVSGASTVQANDLQFTKLSATVDGASFLRLPGRAEEMWLKVGGASQVDGESFLSKIGNIEISGASRVSLGECATLAGNVDVASTLRYRGTPESAYGLRVDLTSYLELVPPASSGGTP